MNLSIRIAVLAVALAAASDADAAKRAALVFSAQKYEFLRPLKNPGRDAAAVATALERLGFDVTIETDRNLRRMSRALDDFGEDAEGAEIALVYFAGHGVEIAGENRLLPTDADASSLAALKSSSLALEEVRAAAAAAAPAALILLDACRDDPFGAGEGTGRSAKALGNDVAAAAHPGFGRIGRAENSLFAFAASPGETASDGTGDNSPFSSALARLLPTDGLEIRSVLTLVQQEVYETTGGNQLPYVESALPAVFFAAATGELPERERLLLAMADVTPDLRAEVESVAAEADMPLGPLFGALIAADLRSLSAEDRRQKLEEAAAAFARTREELARLSGGDPMVAALRDKAGEALAKGAFSTARALLDEASALDEQSRTALKANFVSRTLSAAETRLLAGLAARATLDRRAAIAEFEAAAELYGEVESEKIDSRARGRFVWMFADLGDLYGVVGDTKAALASYETMRSAAEYRLSTDPQSLDAQRDVLAATMRTANALRISGATRAALAAYRKAREGAEKLYAAHPDDSGLARDLAIAWSKTGDAAFSIGDFGAAATAFSRDVDLSRAMAAAAPGNADSRRDLALALERAAGVDRVLGRSATALSAFDEAIALKRALVAETAGAAESRHDLGVGLGARAELRLAVNDAGGAQSDLAEAIELYEALASDDPGNVRYAHSLARTIYQQALLSHGLGDAQAALAGFDDAVARFGDLRQADLVDARIGRDLAGALANRAAALRQTGQTDAAHAAIEDALALNGELLRADPDNADLARDRALALERKGDIALGGGDAENALDAYRAALEQASLLAARADSALARRDLSAMELKVGDALRTMGRREDAVASYRRALSLRLELARAEPDNAARQRDLILAHARMAEMGVDRRDNLAAALAIAEALEASGRLSQNDAAMPARLRQALAASQ